MSISKFTTELPCRVETLKNIKLNFTVQTADDEISKLKGTNGDIIASFTDQSPRHTETGQLIITVDNSEESLRIDNLIVDIEQGAPSPPYKTIGSIAIKGVDTTGRMWQGVSSGPSGDTSIAFECATSDKPNAHAQENELKKHFS